MSLNNIKLSTTILPDLYKHSLMDINTEKTYTEKETENGIIYLGDNKKNVAIIVSSPNSIYLPDDELHFLINVLNACHLSMADVALINIFTIKSISYTLLKTEYNAEKILLFGVPPKQLEMPLQFPNFQIQKYNNQTYLSAPDLHILQSDMEEKKKLWNCLQQIFLS